MAAADTTPNDSRTDAGAAEAPPGFLSSYGTLLTRDVGIALALLSFFAAADAWRVVSETAFAGLLSTLNGLIAGFVVASLAHEWGHLAGGRWSGAHMTPKPILAIPQVFDFDYAKNNSEQFKAMSIGGNVGHFLVLLLFVLALPFDTIGRVALVAGAIGQAVFASSIEFPVIRKAMAGMPPADALATIPRDFVKRNGRAGAIAALIALVIL